MGMASDTDAVLLRIADPPRPGETEPPSGGGSGPAGNARLTALTGSALLVPIVVVLGSGLVFSQLRTAHFFAGFVLLPLTALKLASTGYRVLRYYVVDRRDRAYRSSGPPWWLPRVLGPAVGASAVVALVTGVVLWAQRSERGTWSTVHTDSAVIFAVLIGLHLLLRAWRTVWNLFSRFAGDGTLGPAALHPLELPPGAAQPRYSVAASVTTVTTSWPVQPDRHAGAGPRDR